MLDGSVLNSGFDGVIFEVDDADGIWDGDELTLDLTWTFGGLELWLRLTSG